MKKGSKKKCDKKTSKLWPNQFENYTLMTSSSFKRIVYIRKRKKAKEKQL